MDFWLWDGPWWLWLGMGMLVGYFLPKMMKEAK